MPHQAKDTSRPQPTCSHHTVVPHLPRQSSNEQTHEKKNIHKHTHLSPQDPMHTVQALVVRLRQKARVSIQHHAGVDMIPG